MLEAWEESISVWNHGKMVSLSVIMGRANSEINLAKCTFAILPSAISQVFDRIKISKDIRRLNEHVPGEFKCLIPAFGPTFDQGFFLYFSIAPVVEKINDETLVAISTCLEIDEYAEHFDFDCEQGKRSFYQTRVHATLGHPRHLWQKGVTDRRTPSILDKITAVSLILL